MSRYLSAVLALALLASACSSGEKNATTDPDSPSSEEASNTLIAAVGFAPTSGLAIDTDDALTLADSGSTEGLVRSGPDGEPSPGLAESWTRVDETTWEFTLRPDVSFHDDTPLTADAVETAFDYLANSATPPRILKGVGLSAKAVDSQTVKISTTSPDPILPLRLSSPSTAILALAAYESEVPDPIGHGTGPFEIVDFKPEQSLTVERFEQYWGDTAKLDGAIVRFLPEASSRAAAIRSGDVDLAEGIALADLDAIEKDETIELEKFSLPRTTSLYTNTSNGVMSNPEIREAAQLAIDQEAVANDLLEGEFAPASSYFGKETKWAPEPDVSAQPKKAKELLELAGFSTDGTDPELSVNLWTYPDRPELEDIAVAIQDQLEQVGFSVEIIVSEYSTLEPKALAAEHDLFLLSRSYYIDIADAGAFLASDFSCEGGYNLNVYCSEDFDKIIDGLAEATETEDRETLFAAASKLLTTDNVGITLAHDQARIARSTKVDGYVPDPFERTLITAALSLN